MKVSILHKHVSMARRAIRQRIADRSIFVRRLYGQYYIYAHVVTEKQQKQRNIFAQAQSLAHAELSSRSHRRFWSREAVKHNVKDAHRMAVSFFCKMLRKYKGEMDKVFLVLDSIHNQNSSTSRIISLKHNVYALKNNANPHSLNVFMKSRQKNTTQLCYSNEKSINLQRAINYTLFP